MRASGVDRPDFCSLKNRWSNTFSALPYKLGLDRTFIEVAHPNLDGKVSGTYCSSACAGHNKFEKGQCISLIKAQLIAYTMSLQTKVV